MKTKPLLFTRLKDHSAAFIRELLRKAAVIAAIETDGELIVNDEHFDSFFLPSHKTIDAACGMRYNRGVEFFEQREVVASCLEAFEQVSTSHGEGLLHGLQL